MSGLGSLSNETISTGHAAPALGRGTLLVLLALVSGCVLFWPGLRSLPVAWQKEEYSHGYIIPFIALFLALKCMGPVPSRADRGGNRVGSLFVILGLVTGFFGLLAAIPDIVTYGMLIVLAGFAILVRGLRGGFALWPAWIYLAFMLPLPNFIYWPLSIKLQFISSELGVAIIRMLGIPVFLEGNIIDLGNYKLQVAEACNGLRYLFPLFSFGFLFAALYRGPVWQKIIICLSAIPITILMNSVRIGMIGFLVDRFGGKQAEGYLHYFEGWVVFVICILLLFLIAIILQRFTANPKPIMAVLDLDTQGLLQRLRRLATIPATGPLAGATLLLVLAMIASFATSGRSNIHPDRLRLESFPAQISSYKGVTELLEPDIERVLGADDYLVSTYEEPSRPATAINLLIAYYRAQNEGSGIHSPEVCLPGGGWEVSGWSQTSVPVKSLAGGQLRVNQAIIQKGESRQLVYYWFEERGRHLTNDYAAKAWTVWDSIMHRRSDGAIIRLVTPMGQEPLAVAQARLNGFVNDIMANVPDYVPN